MDFSKSTDTKLSNSLILGAIQALIQRGRGLSKTQKTVSIGAAVLATLSYFFFKKISTPPKSLRHIPSVNYVRMMKAYFTGEPLMNITKRIVNPVINSKGVYLRPSRGLWNVYITDAELAKVVYNKTDLDLFPKVDLTAINQDTYNGKFSARSNNLFFSVGDEWKKQRRIANPAFHRAMPIKLFGNYTERLFDAMSNVTTKNERTEINVGTFVERYALDVLGSAGFDFDFNSLHNPKDEYVERYGKVMNAVINPLFYFFPNLDRQYLWLFPKRKEIHQELEIFLSMVREIIAKKRETMAIQKDLSVFASAAGNNSKEFAGTSITKTEKDILELLIESAQSDENSDLSIADDDMLLSNLCILFTAGHETTTAAILFLMYELAINRDMQQKAREEVISVLGDGENVLPTVDQLAKLDYLNMLMKETLRLHPPVPVSSPRRAAEDCHLGDTFIPKGSTVVIDVISIHRSPQTWAHPDKFVPERFAPGGESEKKALGAGMSFSPFGGGARHCIGRNFTLNEQRVMLSMFLKKYTWELPENSIHKNGLVTKGIFLLSPVNMSLIIKPRY